MDEQFSKIWQQLGLLADNQAKSVTAHAQTAQGYLRMAEAIERVQLLIGLHQTALVALAAAHPAKDAALATFQELWNERRGPLGVDGISDASRAVVQTHLDDLAGALGGKVL